MRMTWMEKNSMKYFSAKHCFLCSKSLWKGLARINIFLTWGIDWVMMLLNQSCAGLNAPKQKSSPSPLTFCVYHRLWICWIHALHVQTPSSLLSLNETAANTTYPWRCSMFQVYWKAFLWCFASAIASFSLSTSKSNQKVRFGLPAFECTWL